MKCANCNNDAMYEYKITSNNSVLYCGTDLPKFLESRKKALLIDVTPAHSKASEEALSALQIKSSELPKVEDEAEPKKRAVKKKAK